MGSAEAKTAFCLLVLVEWLPIRPRKDIFEFLLCLNLNLNPNLLDSPIRQKTVLVIVLNTLKQSMDLLISCF